MKTIIVVDDDADAAEVMAQALAARDRLVRAFADPIRALAAITAERTDLLIADLAMPWLDGKDVLVSARMRRPGLPILLVSGLAGAADVAASEGVPFFAKPVNLDRLRRAVDQVLAIGDQPGHPSAGR